MNNDEQELTPQNSKCWGCKFGMCLSETQRQTIFHPGVEEEEEVGDIFDMDISPEFQPNEAHVSAHQVDLTRCGAICYWGGMNVGNEQPPIRVEFVTDCSRFEPREVDKPSEG